MECNLLITLPNDKNDIFLDHLDGITRDQRSRKELRKGLLDSEGCWSNRRIFMEAFRHDFAHKS